MPLKSALQASASIPALSWDAFDIKGLDLVKSWSLAVGKALTVDTVDSEAVQLAGRACVVESQIFNGITLGRSVADAACLPYVNLNPASEEFASVVHAITQPTVIHLEPGAWQADNLDPQNARAWVGIGNAYYRMSKPDQALEAFEKAVELDSNDGYTHRNLGGILIGFKRIDEALVHLRKALKLMPDDPQAIFGLATALDEVGTEEAEEEADAGYQRFILEHSTSPMVVQAEKSRTAFAHKRLKSRSAGGFRPDVMMYILDALKTFKKVGPAKRREIALEIAMLGRSGLDINDPDSKYKLKTLTGIYSGLNLLVIMYTAFHQIDPAMETGADFSAEYAAALAMLEK